MNMVNHPVYVSGAAAISAFGFEWRGLGQAIRKEHHFLSPSEQLAETAPNTLAAEVPSAPLTIETPPAKLQKLMSRAAYLSAMATQRALIDTGWTTDHEHTGFYLGVGASGGSIPELTSMLQASIGDHQFSLERFGSAGLASCNPLYAFQLMNNFTLCHAAILSGIAGPNNAFYSRGNGTAAALFEAMHAIAEGDCNRALAGGADSAIHPVTWAELRREGYIAKGFIPGEGAALLALSNQHDHALAMVEQCMFHNTCSSIENVQSLLDQLLTDIAPTSIDGIVIAPWGTPPRKWLQTALSTRIPHATTIDLTRCLGDALAATPTLAWIAAVDLIQANIINRCLVIHAGIDGGMGAILISKIRS